MATYTFRLFTNDGKFITTLDQFISAEIGRKKNDIGAVSILVPFSLYDPFIFAEDNILEVWRHEKTDTVLVGSTCWFLRKVVYTQKGDGAPVVELVFYDTIELLRRRVNAWFLYEREELAAGIFNHTRQYPSNLYESAHDVLVDLFMHNFIEPWTTETRWQPDLAGNRPAGILPAATRAATMGFPALKGSQAQSPEIMLSSAWKPVLDAMKEAANASQSRGINLWFDIVYTPNSALVLGTLAFTVWEVVRGSDRTATSNSFIFSPDFGNLVDVTLTLDYTEAANTVYAITQNDILYADAEVKPVPIKNVGVANKHTTDYLDKRFYPIETVVELGGSNSYSDAGAINNNRDSIDPLILEQLAYDTLYAVKKKEVLTGTIIQTIGSRLFSDYNYGDLVLVSAFGLDFKAEIDSFVISIDEDGREDIKIPLNATAITIAEN